VIGAVIAPERTARHQGLQSNAEGDASPREALECGATAPLSLATVTNWYKYSKGRVTQNWPFTLLEFWSQTKTPNPDDYEMLQLGAGGWGLA
jgi:hypothetical protein